MEPKSFVCLMSAVLLLVGSVVLLRDPTALRDDVDGWPRRFSYGRVQLWFWTVLVLGSYIAAYCLTTGTLTWNETALALLGVSGATTTAARILDGRTAMPSLSRAQSSSKGFLFDIMSDDHGLSINRFQAVMFNVVYGGYYLAEVIESLRASKVDFTFPVLDAEQLTLLGISSGTYLALKLNEGTPAVPADANAAPALATALPVGAPALGAVIASTITSDELPDLDPRDDCDEDM